MQVQNGSSNGMTRAGSLAQYTGLKVFSATMHKDRESLGDKVTDWLEAQRAKHADHSKAGSTRFRVAETTVTQSSDSEFHCLTITIFYVIDPR